MADWFHEAKERGTVTYPGDGSQYWPLVHRNDVADAYRLGLEHAAAGDRFLLADGSAHTVREIAEAIAAVTGATAQPLPADGAHRDARRGGRRAAVEHARERGEGAARAGLGAAARLVRAGGRGDVPRVAEPARGARIVDRPIGG
jgi:nucleoside-diphosphate-sugar epimerase